MKPQANGPRIGIASIDGADNVSTWSGTPYHMVSALEPHFEDLVHLSPLRAPLLNAFKAYGRLIRLLTKRQIIPRLAAPVARQYANDVQRRILAETPDIVFAPAGSPFIGGVPDDVLFVYTSDATFRLVEDYHPQYQSLTPFCNRNAEKLERMAIERADLLLYPSDWAARSAVEDYGIDPKRVHVIPWGANIDRSPTREEISRPRKPGPFRLLFVGVDWVEKGAQIAIDTLYELKAADIEVELTICGCTPPAPVDHEHVTIIPFLDKNNPTEKEKLKQLYLEADLFFCQREQIAMAYLSVRQLLMACQALHRAQVVFQEPLKKTFPEFCFLLTQSGATTRRRSRKFLRVVESWSG